jgi:Cu-processing system permease protein
MRGILIFVDLTIREARRQRIVWAALGLGAAFLILFGVGLHYIGQEMRLNGAISNIALNTGFNFVVMAGLYVVSFLGVVLAVLTSVAALSGEVTSHTIQALAVKPVPRASIVLGKWLGLGMMLTVYILLLAGGVILITYAFTGYMLPNAIPGMFLIVFQALIMLTVSILGGTCLSTIANGVVAFMVYGLAFIGGWIEAIGSVTHIDTAVDLGIMSSLLVPSEAMWRMASHIMQPPVVSALGLSPFSLSIAPSTAMLVYAFAYVIVLMACAIYTFEHRDL